VGVRHWVERGIGDGHWVVTDSHAQDGSRRGPGEAEGRGRGTPGLGFQGAGCEPRDEARVESHEKNKVAMRCQMTDGRERVRCWEGVAHRWGWRVQDGAKRRGGLDQVQQSRSPGLT